MGHFQEIIHQPYRMIDRAQLMADKRAELARRREILNVASAGLPDGPDSAPRRILVEGAGQGGLAITAGGAGDHGGDGGWGPWSPSDQVASRRERRSGQGAAGRKQ